MTRHTPSALQSHTPALEARDLGLAGLLFSAALAIRGLSIDGEVFGDESLYFYLARTFGREPTAALDDAWFHLLNRPLFYVVYHLGTYAGFPGFRWFASVLCALVVALCFLVARTLGASRWSASLTSSVLAIERPLVEYGTRGFPDPLASGLALGALWAARRGSGPAMFSLATACVLSKESFVAVPLIAVFVRALGPARRPVLRDAWTWATLLVPLGYVALTTLAGMLTPGIAMQGWANAPFTWKHARGMWVGPELWPLIAWVSVRAKREGLFAELGIWLGLPAFYALWSWVLGRGLSPWYVIGPATLAAAAAPRAIDLAADAARRRWGAYGNALTLTLLIASLVPVAWAGALRVASQARDVGKGVRAVDAAAEVVTLLERLNPERVLLIHCFWSYGYSHLRGASQPASRSEWLSPEDAASLIAQARSAQITIMCRSPENLAKEQQLANSGFESLLQNDKYWVVKPQGPGL